MSKNNENKLVPRLRFPEFTNENWNRKTIDETCEILNNFRKPLTTNLREKGIYPYYGASGIIDYVKDYIFNERLLLIGEDGAKWLAYEKTAFIAEGKYWVNNHAHVLKPIGVVDSLLENYLVKLDISPFITGAAPPKLTLGKLKSIPVPIPENQKEQQKIAACLSSLDDVITAESKKLEVLKEHKKGLLQNLFPQQGETVPKLRFKEFEDSGEWEENVLKEVTTFVHEKTQLKTLSIDSYISTENLLSNYAGVTLASKLPSSGNFTKYQKGDILISNIRPYLKKVWFADKNGACSNDVIVIRGKSLVLDIFLSFLLRNDDFINYIMKSAEGVKMPRGDKDSIKEYLISFPKEKSEQQKIADTLSSIDDLINAQSQKIETLKLHKKGLLQGLFPDVNEHNG